MLDDSVSVPESNAENFEDSSVEDSNYLIFILSKVLVPFLTSRQLGRYGFSPVGDVVLLEAEA